MSDRPAPSVAPSAGTPLDERGGGAPAAGDAVAQQAAAPERQPAKGPALAVIGIVAVITLGGVLLALAGSHPSRPKLGASTGSPLAAIPAARVFDVVVSGGEPPSDVLGNLVVPSGAERTGHRCASGGVSLYDCQVELSLPQAPPSVLSFFKTELKRHGWTQISVDATDAGRGTELLDQIPSGDGYYWEVGVFVDPVSSSSAGAPNGAGSAVEVRVIERDDGD